MMEHQEQQLEEERLAHVLDEIDTQLTQSRDQIARRESEMVAVQRCLKKTLQKAWFTTGGHQSPVYSTVFSLGLLIIWHQSAALMAM